MELKNSSSGDSSIFLATWEFEYFPYSGTDSALKGHKDSDGRFRNRSLIGALRSESKSVQ